MSKNRMVRPAELLSFLVILTILLAPLVSSTSITQGDVPADSSNTIVGPGAERVQVFNFTVLDGGDEAISGTFDAGDALFEFMENRTLFLNQTDTAITGNNGYDDGEDIFNVSWVHSAGNKEVLSGSLLGNFSGNVSFADGGNLSDGSFNGDNASGNAAEALVKDNTSSGNPNELDQNDYIVSEGRMNISNFSDNVQFVDLNPDNGVFDAGSEALIRSQSSNLKTLADADTVLLESDAGLTAFAGSVKFADGSDDNSNFESDRAIIDEQGARADILEPADQVLVNGSIDLNVTSSTNLSYYNATGTSTALFDNEGEPIYYENRSQDGVVNTSEARIGDITVVSWNDNDSSTVDLNLTTLDVIMNVSGPSTEDAELGKTIQDVVDGNTGYGGDGSFKVLEYSNGGSPDGVWNPSDGTDQDVLIYDLQSNTPVSEGETLIFNSNLYSGNIPDSVLPGDEFNVTEASSVDSGENSYQPTVNITFDGSDTTYDPGNDNVTLNVSHGGNWEVVKIAPRPENLEGTGYGGSLYNGGVMRFWDADASSDGERADGLFVDMDEDGIVSEGDARIGEWSEVESAGVVQNGDVDIGLSVVNFSDSADRLRTIDADHNNLYSPGDGTVSSSSGREAIIMSSDNELDTADEVVRSGRIDVVDFQGQDPDMNYIDANEDGSYTGGEAIVRDDGGNPSQLEEGDTIARSGDAALTNVSNSTRYIENGQAPGFETSEAIVNDSMADGIFAPGPLDTAPDTVLRQGDANLMPVPGMPSQENDSGLVYVDKNRTGMYQAGEDILNITLITNGSASGKINGTEIYNFANTTRHNGSAIYENGDAIANDTDGNNVYQEVLRSIEIVNSFSQSNPDFLRNITNNEVENGVLELFRDANSNQEFDEGADNSVATLNYDSGASEPTWNVSGMNQNISSDTSFFVTFNSTGGGSLGDYAYAFRAENSDWGTAGSQTFSDFSNSKEQIVDAHAPEIVDAWTGNLSGGNSHKDARNKIYVETNEQYQGLDYGSLQPSDFFITFENGTSISVAKNTVISNIISRSSQNFEVILNNSFETNRTFDFYLGGEIADRGSSGNIRRGTDPQGTGANATDGIRPRILDIVYKDDSYNGSIDEVEVLFSENVTYSNFEAQDWQFDDRGLSGINVTNGTVANDYLLELNATADPWITGVENESRKPSLNYTVIGNMLSDQSSNFLSEVSNYSMGDEAGPVIANATTKDPDNDASIERIFLEFSEDIDDGLSEFSNSTDTSMNINPGSIDGFQTNQVNDSKVQLNVSDLGNTSTTPSVFLYGEWIYDEFNNTIPALRTFNNVQDNSSPVLLHAEINHLQSDQNRTFVNLVFSEPVNKSSGNDHAVNMSNKSLNLSDSGFGETRRVNYEELLQTGSKPNITYLSENITDLNDNPVRLKNNDSVVVNTFRKEMVEGWNFVSFPIADSTTPEINETLNTSKISVVWTYNGSSWSTYDPEAPSNDFNNFQGGKGYLINATEEFVLTPNVNNLKSEEITGKASTTIGNGWNLVGQFQEFDQRANSTRAFAKLSENDIGAVRAQSETAGLAVETLIRDDVGSNPRTLETGKGYWLWWAGDKDSYAEPTLR